MLRSLLKISGMVALVFSFSNAWANGVSPEEKKTFNDIIELSGQFNTTYNYNLNNPNPSANSLRVFDVQHNDFNLDLFDLVIAATPVDWAKFRVDIDAGENVSVVDGTKGGVIATDEFGIQQAFVELTAPVGNGLTFKAGHFVTLLGHEVIESASNWNTSRSLLFGFAIPFTHTGLLMTYPWSDMVSTTVGVVNGWDVIGDNNKSKSFIGQIVSKPADELTLSLQGIYGAEQAGSDSNMRGIVDFVADWTPVDEFTLGANFDLGKEEGVGGNGFANWWGPALYAHWVPLEHVGFTFRGEYFQDDGSRQLACGTVAVPAACAGLDSFEATGTLNFYITDGWESRLEFRHDQTDQAIFAKSDGTFRKFQDTISAELLYSF